MTIPMTAQIDGLGSDVDMDGDVYDRWMATSHGLNGD